MENKNKNNRRKSIHIRLDDSTFELLNEQKRNSGFKSWEALIIHYMNGGKGFKSVYVDKEGHSLKVLNYLIKYGNNLNQLAKIANERKSLNDDDLKKIKDFLSQGIKAKNYFTKHVKQAGRGK
ncbi:hypothetical protein MGA5115_02231 [Marinomonas gallaica]|uniref:Bacterial mobilisation domain-containing protein n=1 Tax=Marinomonas gallaica TaxID=1806667 RepID=A0A1C3JSA5_9GAMM|nr:plasmid mobilization relaxosome protein MobC [Marinomonas gallaica]SBT18111.1 hypothetical protein MGA5115_02231 [Marinomonas gallaica]SBT22491.1 hypothetical protein MGA5116_03113 [Marinomonas gallaica]